MRSLGEKSDPKLAGPALEHFALDNVLIIRFFVGLAHGVAQTPMRRANPCERIPASESLRPIPWRHAEGYNLARELGDNDTGRT
jgi:hypothetical protein